jgi:hypothetical protein
MKNILLLLLLTSCVTPKKAVDVLSRPKNEPVAAEFCATKYPVKDSIIKGDSVVRFDTLWETFTDTLISEPQVIIETKLVPKTVTKWVTIRDTIIRENTARVAVLGSQIAKLNEANRNLVELNADLSQKLVRISDERDTFKHERNKWKLRFFLLLFGFGLAYALKVKTTKKLF